MDRLPNTSATESSLPTAFRRKFQLVRLLHQEVQLREKCSQQELLILTQRCEEFRRSFLELCATFQPCTKLRLAKMEFLRLWSTVAAEIYSALLELESVENSTAAIELIPIAAIPNMPSDVCATNESSEQVPKVRNEKTEIQCLQCSEPHGLLSCNKFAKSRANEQWRLLKHNGLCFLCLQPGHSKMDCRSCKKCDYCGNRHATVIHSAMKVMSQAFESNRRHSCDCCGQGHLIHQCDQFGGKTATERKEFIVQHQLCSNCFHAGHSAADCQHPSNCRHCGKRHHSLLHLAFGPPVYRN